MVRFATAEQELLRDTLRRWYGDTRDEADRMRVAQPEPPLSPADWQGIADLGLVGLLVAEDQGGAGCGPAELSIVADEMGRGLARLPFADMVVGGVGLLAQSGSKATEDVISGNCIVTFADGRDGAIRANASSELSGRLRGVPGLGIANKLVVAAADETGSPSIWMLEQGWSGTDLVLDSVSAQLLASGQAAHEMLAAVDDLLVLARLADSVGAMDEMLRLTVEHLNTRQQFGKPLSAFQALRLRVADMFVETEMARSMVIDLASACEPGQDPVRRRVASAAARLQVFAAVERVGFEAIQLHGGMGMTWEHRVGHLARRAIATSLSLRGESAALDALDGLPSAAAS